jgi:hypothetical protein
MASILLSASRIFARRRMSGSRSDVVRCNNRARGLGYVGTFNESMRGRCSARALC